MRRILLRLIGFGAFICALCLIWGFFIEPKMLKTRHVSFDSPAWDGPELRIGIITDIHIGGLHVSPKRVEQIAAQMMEHKPDIIILPGDFIDGHKARSDHSARFNTDVDEGLAHFSRLSAPYGVYATIGNHDEWYDTRYVHSQLTKAGVQVLDNGSAAPLEGLCLVGLADAYTGAPDMKAFDGCADNDFKLVAAHSADVVLLDMPRTGLLIAGHSHGGQINLPLLGRAVTSTKIGKPYAYGFSRHSETDLFVSAGVGTSILPARFRAPPEIVILTLR